MFTIFCIIAPLWYFGSINVSEKHAVCRGYGLDVAFSECGPVASDYQILSDSLQSDVPCFWSINNSGAIVTKISFLRVLKW